VIGWWPHNRRGDQEGDPRPRQEAPRKQEAAEANPGTEAGAAKPSTVGLAAERDLFSTFIKTNLVF
jgi:hypothetical protein